MTKPTEEQAAILNAVASSKGDIKVAALAGTGKSTTLRMIAELNPKTRFLYLAYNKSVATEAEEKFPENCKVYTIHGLAMRSFLAKVQNRMGFNRKLNSTWKLRDYIKNFQLKEMEAILDPNEDFYIACYAIKKIVMNFKNSDAKEITPDSVPLADNWAKRYTPAVLEFMYTKANAIWESEIDMDAKTPLDHGTYLKLWEMSEPRLTGYDCILYDEAQDANPVMLSIVGGQSHLRKIYVGDSWQSIYGFNNAVNAMDMMETEHELFLTQSWRFGDSIASEANKLLRIMSPTMKPIRGTPSIPSTVGFIDTTKPYTIITRTNGFLAMKALELINAGIGVYIEGGVKELCADLNALYLLSIGERSNEMSKYRPFGNYAGVMEESKVDVTIRRDLAFVKKFGDDTPEILELLKDTVLSRSHKAHVVLTTAHKSKGLQWNQVSLAEDFKFKILENPVEGKFTEDQELNLLYVAVTRAILTLHLNTFYEAFVTSLTEVVESYRASE